MRLAAEVPVVPPKRRPSHLFSNYLLNPDNANVQQNNQNALKEQEFENKVADLMKAHSTITMMPYNGINLSEQPRIENYSSNGNNNDLLNFNNALSKEVKDAKSSDFDPPYFNLDKEKNINISSVKFGWFEGVFIRTSVNLLGVMLFMRMGWMSAQCGEFYYSVLENENEIFSFHYSLEN